jgi:DNA modification methylase
MSPRGKADPRGIPPWGSLFMNAITKPARPIAAQLAPYSRARRAKRESQVEIAAMSRRNDLLPDLELETRAVAELRPAARKVRKLDPDHVAELAAVISRLGFSVPLLIDGHGVVIDGHARLEAARSLCLETVPCVIVDHLSDAELTALKVAVNRLGEKGQWDIDALRLDFELLDTAAFEIDLTGFSLPEIDIVLSTGEEDTSEPKPEDHIPDAGPAVSRLGDIWRLGRHRLLVGDATQPDNYAVLMDTETASCVFTDPPYNIPIAGFVSPKGKHEDFAMGVGEMSDDDFRTFLSRVLANAKAMLLPGGVIFTCMDWRNLHLLTLAGKDIGLTHINTAVWNKGVGGMGGLYRSAHEMVAVFANGAKPAVNNVELGKHGRDRTNVWGYAGANRKGSSANDWLGDHPTPKPVELVRDALLDVTKRGHIVLDPFMGSGTTIMAAEACGRTAYGMEIDPTYADLVIRRWQAETGGEAMLEGAGKSFQAIADGRRAEASANDDTGN